MHATHPVTSTVGLAKHLEMRTRRKRTANTMRNGKKTILLTSVSRQLLVVLSVYSPNGQVLTHVYLNKNVLVLHDVQF